tara:strand:+ start:947 stop:1372 length:426 start_codon:yes stop_codon:yes gene_type:complete
MTIKKISFTPEQMELAAKLTPKQLLFCQEYLIDLNATQAAIRAGYSTKTAQRIGSENLSKPLVAQFIQLLANERSKRVDIDADWVLEQAVGMFTISKNANDLKAAKGFLELAGKHCKINAFKEIVELEGNVQITQIERKII